MRFSLLSLALLLGSVFPERVFVEVDGDAYVMPTERITADLLIGDRKFKDIRVDELPAKFWERQRRTEIAKLTGRFGITNVLSHLEKVLEDGKGRAQMFSEDGDFILVTDVTPTPHGPRFTTAIEIGVNFDNFKFSQLDLSLFSQQSHYLTSHLRLGSVLANLGHDDLYALSRMHFPHLDLFAGNQETMVRMVKQSISNLLTQLERNERDAPRFVDPEERATLINMIFYNVGRLSKYFADWQLVAGSATEGTPLISYVAGKMTEHHFKDMLKQGKKQEAVSTLLTSGWHDFAKMSKLLLTAVDEYGLEIFGPGEWAKLQLIPDVDPFEPLMVSGIILGYIKSDLLPNKSHLDRLVRKNAFEALWIGQSPEAIKAIAKPFSWIAVENQDVVLPTRVLKMLAADYDASVAARECLLKHMVLDGDRHVLLPWFLRLFASGQAKFNVNETLRKGIMVTDPEIAFLAFPEAYDGKPPVSFSKATIMELLKSGPVDGTLRAVNSVIARLIELRVDMMNAEELYSAMDWARKSHISYVIGKQLYSLLRKEELIPTLVKQMPVGFEFMKEWEGFPLGLDGAFNLETYRTIFTWVPYELDAEIMQKFELFATDLDETDIAFILKTTPARAHVLQILKRQYIHLTGKHVGAVFRFEDILREHANDPVWLVNLARRHWDPSDLVAVKDVFLAHGFSEQVWRLIRFTPQPQVEAYLKAIRRFNNLPFAFLEHLRVERNMSPQQIIKYVEENVRNSEIHV